METGVMLLLGLCVFHVIAYMTPIPPYHSVTRVNLAPKRNDLLISANYVEGDCTFTTLTVYGGIDGRKKTLTWKSLDGYDNFDLDRKSGKMHLALKVKWDRVKYDTITVVTEHYCDYGRVLKTFLHEDLNLYVFYNPN